jgi:hypothetical protein
MTNGEIIEQLENTIGLIKQDGKDWLDDRDIPILEACIKALTALDKIRAMIEQIADVEQKHDEKWAMGLRYAVKVIDKYRGE